MLKRINHMIDLDRYNALMGKSYKKELGRVTRVVGLTVESHEGEGTTVTARIPASMEDE